MNQIITQAIRERRCLRLHYDGFDRLVEPHTYGVNTAGHEAISAYQVAGGSVSKSKPTWREFLVSKARSISLANEVFTGTFSRIYAQL